MAKVICISLRKGGSGKTTTSVNLAAGLQKRNRKTLLIDLDNQSNATMYAGLNPFTLTRSITTVFTDIHIHPRDPIQVTNYGLSVLPATPDLEEVAAGMTARSIGELRPIIEALKDEYEYIVIDTQPGHDYLSLSALVASQYVIIPLQAHYLAMEGVARIMSDIGEVKNGLNPSLSILGIVACMVQNTTISKAILDKTKEDYPGLVLPIEIKLSVQFVNSTLEGKPLVISTPNHAGAKEYMSLVDIVIEKLETAHG
jgi:chromosome partitioning protein